MARNKKMEIAALRRELSGEKQVLFSRIGGDSGTDEGERRQQLLWQNFRVVNGSKANAIVLGTEHDDFVEGRDAAAANSKELFETELFAKPDGVPLERLSTVHSHYFGSGFEKVVGSKLRQFVSQNFDLDEKTKKVKPSMQVVNALRKREARDLLEAEREHLKKAKVEVVNKKPEKVQAPAFAAMAAPPMAFDSDYRPRYASTKMTPDELEERPMQGKGMGKGGFEGF
eukprot:TRINITY_DN109275_c0_g1_i1.p1 TRINITY_DN109275_c0_g1~~TRINITY_DN109275_c0_g1_i1.p1  ORF type:complete len:253 (+),score=70.69 TRINITY_DN109275_c0_g1_i1:78-761(+)